MSVITISRHSALTDDQRRGILVLAKRYSKDLINRPVKTTHKMFPTLRAWMLADIETQISPQFISQLNTEVLLANNPEGKLVGFMVLTRANNSDTACGINYVCVDSDFRLQGIMRRMIDSLREDFTDIALCCFTGLVGAYEKLGFKIGNASEAQVAMRIGKSYNMNKVSPDVLSNHRDVWHAGRLLADKYGKKKAIAIEESYSEQNLIIYKKVEEFVDQRLSASATN